MLTAFKGVKSSKKKSNSALRTNELFTLYTFFLSFLECLDIKKICFKSAGLLQSEEKQISELASFIPFCPYCNADLRTSEGAMGVTRFRFS